jgi:hypothetical protein
MLTEFKKCTTKWKYEERLELWWENNSCDTVCLCLPEMPLYRVVTCYTIPSPPITRCALENIVIGSDGLLLKLSPLHRANVGL